MIMRLFFFWFTRARSIELNIIYVNFRILIIKSRKMTSLLWSDSQGDWRFLVFLLLSPSRSDFPTELISVFVINSYGFFLLLSRSSFHVRFSVTQLFLGNRSPKPPWIGTYIYVGFLQFFSSLSQFTTLLPKSTITVKLPLKMSDYLRKTIQELDLGIDEEPVSLPPEFLARAATANRYSLVVTTVNPHKQNLRALIGQMPRVWGFANSCVGRILGQGRVQFVFQSEEALNLVLRRGPWAFNDWMLSVHRWYPNISDEEMKIINFWVQIKGIPLLYLSNDMAEYVGNQIGFVKEVEFDENANMVEYVRVQMAWNFDNPLRFQRVFHFSAAEATIVKFKFERLRSLCVRCGSLKHDVKDCPLGFDAPQDPPSDDDNPDQGGANNDQQNISEASSLKTIDPFPSIPGLAMDNGKSVINSHSEANLSDLPSVFEDIELTAERLRYLHTKMTRGYGVVHEPFTPDDVVFGIGPSHCKRKRMMDTESYYRQWEAAEDKAVMYQFRKKKRAESQGSCSITGLDGGAGGLVPPEPI